MAKKKSKWEWEWNSLAIYPCALKRGVIKKRKKLCYSVGYDQLIAFPPGYAHAIDTVFKWVCATASALCFFYFFCGPIYDYLPLFAIRTWSYAVFYGTPDEGSMKSWLHHRMDSKKLEQKREEPVGKTKTILKDEMVMWMKYMQTNVYDCLSNWLVLRFADLTESE